MPKKKKSTTGREGNGGERTLQELLVTKLRSLYDVESELIKSLPEMVERSDDADLKEAFEKHLNQTEEHARRLEQALQMLGASAQKLQNEGIRGIVGDAEWVVENIKGAQALDANLIAAAQEAEHYEIAGYGTALEWARLLEQQDLADLLKQTLQEEKDTDIALSALATSKINERVALQ